MMGHSYSRTTGTNDIEAENAPRLAPAPVHAQVRPGPGVFGYLLVGHCLIANWDKLGKQENWSKKLICLPHIALEAVNFGTTEMSGNTLRIEIDPGSPIFCITE